MSTVESSVPRKHFPRTFPKINFSPFSFLFSIISSMKHNQRSASPGELACPHLSDHPTQEAKPKRNDHGSTFVCSDQHTGAPFLTSIGELRTGSAQALADAICPFRLQAALVRIRNLKSKIMNARKGPDFLKDFYKPVRLGHFYFCFNSRSATENRTETKLRKIEKKLRFSVQTETFSPLPTTYVRKCENKKFLRQPPPHTTIVDWLPDVARAWASPARTGIQKHVGTFMARKWHVNWHVRICKNPSKTRKLARKTHSFFLEDPNVDPVPVRSLLLWPVRPAQKIKMRACVHSTLTRPLISRRKTHFSS
jgi:hypothetical protein